MADFHRPVARDADVSPAKLGDLTTLIAYLYTTWSLWREWVGSNGAPDINNLIERVRHDKNRPLLQTDDPEAKLRELMQIREPLYRETADITINTGEKSIRAVINVILDRLQSYQDQQDS